MHASAMPGTRLFPDVIRAGGTLLASPGKSPCLHWHAEIWGKDKEWESEITEQVPDR